MNCIISRMSIINRFLSGETEPKFYSENERPCKEAVLSGVKDICGNITARFMIDIRDISHLAALTKIWGYDAVVTTDKNFPLVPTIVIYDI